MKSILKWINYSSILMDWILFIVIYCKTVQFATVNQIQFTTVNLNYSNLLAIFIISDCSQDTKDWINDCWKF